MSKFVAILTAGAISVHLPDTTGNYATLCGLDGADEHAAVDQQQAAVPPKAKVTCQHCKNIWAVAKQYRATDFDV